MDYKVDDDEMIMILNDIFMLPNCERLSPFLILIFSYLLLTKMLDEFNLNVVPN